MFDRPDSTSVDRLLEFPESDSKIIKDEDILDQIKQEDEIETFLDYQFIEMVRSEIREISVERAEKGEEEIMTHLPFTPMRSKIVRKILKLLGWKFFHRVGELPEMVEASLAEHKDVTEFAEDLDVIIKRPEGPDKKGPEKVYKVEKEDIGQILRIARRLYFSDLARKIKKQFMPSDIVIGFDIGTEYIKYAQLRKQKGKYFLDRYEITRLELSEDSGTAGIMGKASLGIQKILPFDLLPIADVVVSFSDIEVITRTEKFPTLEPKELKEAVLYKATKELPESIKNPEVKYEVLEASGSKDEAKLTVQMFVYDKTELEKWLTILSEIGIAPRKVNLPHISLENNLRTFYPEEYEKGTVVFDFGGRKSQFIFAEHGSIKFIRSISFGVNNFLKALTGPAHVGEDVVEIDRDKASKLLRTYGISDPNSLGNTEHKIPIARVGIILFEPIQALVNEIKRSIDFIKSKYPDSVFNNILLTGGGSEMINLDHVLAERLEIPVKRFSIFPQMLIGRDVTEADKLIKDSYMLGGSVGLALDESNDLNLLPEERQLSRKNNSVLLGALIGLIITIITLSNMSLDILDEIELVEADLDVAGEEWDMMQPSINEYNSLLNQSNVLENLNKYIEEQYGLKSKEIDFGDYLKIFSNHTPEHIIINHFEILERKMENVFEGGNYYRALSPQKIIIKGQTSADDPDKSILEFILTLRGLPYFSEVTLQEEEGLEKLGEREFKALLIVKG
ncbi:pilus assembly protein PilM [candidate division KSB1 bacterium]